MKIAYLTCVYPPYPGGIGVLAQGMATEMTKRGHEVEVFTPDTKQRSKVAVSQPVDALATTRGARREYASGLACSASRLRVSSDGVVVRPKDETGLRQRYEQPQRQPCTVHQLKPWFRYGNAAFLPQVVRMLKGFDIVHLLYPFFGVAELAPLIKWRSRGRLVVHHTMDPDAPGLLGKFFVAHASFLMPAIFKRADLIITLSEDFFQGSSLTDVYQEFDQAPPIAFIPNGVDTDLFRPRETVSVSQPVDASATTRGARREYASGLAYSASRLRVSSDGVVVRSKDETVEPQRYEQLQRQRQQLPVILFVGGLDRAHYFKGLHILVEALKILQWGGIHFRCAIVGEGDMRKEYESHAKELGLLEGAPVPSAQHPRVTLAPGTVQFTGFVAHEQLPRYYQQAAVCVVPSTEAVENFSIVAAEAQACGIPVVVSDFPGVRTTVEDAVTGLIVRPGDPEDLAHTLFAVLEDHGRAKKMGQAGRKRAERLYSWKVVGDKLEEAYKSL